MISYWISHKDKFIEPLIEHLQITLITLVISIALAFVLTILIRKSKRLSNIVIQGFGAFYSIPSLALFALLIPVTGLGNTTAIIVLVLYNQFLLIRNFVQGLENVDPSITEAARGMGMTDMQILFKVEIPLSLGMILTGIRLAIVSTIGIATIAATIGAGGLGVVLFQGLRQMNKAKIVGGTLLCTLVAVLANGLLKLIENRLVLKD